MKKFLVGLIAVFATVAALAGEVGSYPTATTLGGTERILADQSGVTKNMTPGQILTYVLSQGVPLTSLPTQASPTILGNYSGSTTTPVALNPLAVANMQGAVINVLAVATANITLSGSQTVDGNAVGSGQTVLVAAQTTASQNGIYISASGAWTRAPNFPGGYVIQQNCDLMVGIRSGTTFAGAFFKLNTSAALTIGTSSLTFSQIPVFNATNSLIGGVTISDTGSTGVPSIISGNNAIANGDCVSFTSANGAIGDNGNIATPNVGGNGACVIADIHGNPVVNGTGIAPAVTGTGCSLTAGGRNATGSIVATGVDTCTLTFNGAFITAPNCTVSGLNATVLPTLNALPTTTAAVFKTAAAGTFTYLCF